MRLPSALRLPSSTRRRGPIVAALVTLLTSLGIAGIGTSAPTAQAATGCQVGYQVDQWVGGFVATMTLAVGDTAAHGWTLTWTYPAGQQVTSAWSAQVTQSATAITARNLSYNGEIPAGGSIQFGVQGTSSTTNPAPTDFALNGVACNGAAASPSASTTGSPSGSPSPSSPSPSPTTSSSPPPAGGGCGSAALCDGFESQNGTSPAGLWSVAFPNCQGSGTATVDTAVAHAGTHSIRIDGAAGYCNHVFVRATSGLSGIGSTWYGRFYVRHSTALPAAHVTFVAMSDANDGPKDLRMGGQNSALQWNRESDDATLPEQSPAGVALSAPLPTNTWTCLEFAVDGSAGTLRTWANGSAVPGLQEDGVPTKDIDSQWLGRANWRPSLTDLRLGWESYGDGADTLWFDDVAVGSTRVGC